MVREHDLHLKASLEDKYKVTTYWEGKLYIGIALKWDYEKVTVQLSMPEYVRKALRSFQHDKPNITSTHLAPVHNPYMVKTITCYQKNYQLKNCMKIIIKDTRKL